MDEIPIFIDLSREGMQLKRLGVTKMSVLLPTNSTKHDLDGVKAALVVGNLHRNEINTKDMTAACVFLSKSTGKSKTKSFGNIFSD